MSRRLVPFLLIAFLASVSQGSIAAAQTQTTTSAAPTSTTQQAATTQTSAQGATSSSTQTTESTVLGREPEEGYVDPLVGEGGRLVEEGEPVDLVDETLEGNPKYGGQPQYQAPQILRDKVNESKARYEETLEDFTSAIQFVKDVRTEIKLVENQIERLDQRSAALLELAEGIRISAETRAVTDFMIYQQGETLSPLGSNATVAELMEKYSMDQLLEIDSEEIDAYNRIRDSIAAEVLILEADAEALSKMVVNAEQVAAEYRITKDQAQIEFEAFSAGSEVFISGVVFPISGAVSLPLIDSFGFPRMPGTADAHWHEGIDIFAPKGTPLVATESGTITRVGSGRLGGLKFWLQGDSGVEWYYAHLHAFAPGLANGQKVEAGDLVGYVGDTGNAVGTPPHLHMEMHPNGERPINPYPLLAMVIRTEQINGINAFAPEQIYDSLNVRNQQ